jgi:hypothetical protein
VIPRIVLLILVFASCSAAQSRPETEVRIQTGWVGFIDEEFIDHGLIGGSVRYYVTRRFAIEPEAAYLIGPGDDRDITLIPHVSLDFRPGSRVRPYVIGGVGFHHFRDKIGAFSITSNQWVVNGGFGVTVPLTDRFFIAPEFRLGFETLVRVGVAVGFVF